MATVMFVSCSQIESIETEEELLPVSIVESNDSQTGIVTTKVAAYVADVFISKYVDSKIVTKSSFKLPVETIYDENGKEIMYIVNYPDGGYVITGATRNYYPILAYSDKGAFHFSENMGAIDVWLDETKVCIQNSESLSDSVKADMQTLWRYYEKKAEGVITQRLQTKSNPTAAELACWDRCDELQMIYGSQSWIFLPLSDAESYFEDAGLLSDYEEMCSYANTNNSPLNGTVIGFRENNVNDNVGPLLNTTWHQEFPYNRFTPIDSLNNHLPTGSAAIALGQIMKYYEYPSVIYDIYSNRLFWNDILDYDDINNSYQARLIQMITATINTNYLSDLQSTTLNDMEDGISDIGFDVQRTSHSLNAVLSSIIDREEPVIMYSYANQNPSSTPFGNLKPYHYWVCDGARDYVNNRYEFFLEYQIGGNGVFDSSWYSINNPGLIGGLVSQYLHMNWGLGYLQNTNTWLLGNNVNALGIYTFNSNRTNFYLSNPNN